MSAAGYRCAAPGGATHSPDHGDPVAQRLFFEALMAVGRLYRLLEPDSIRVTWERLEWRLVWRGKVPSEDAT